MENTQRDPSSPWKTPSGSWRLRTYSANVYEAASDAALLAGKWKDLGVNKDFRQCECPSFYPLPAATPGVEAEYDAALAAGMPDHVHKVLLVLLVLFMLLVHLLLLLTFLSLSKDELWWRLVAARHVQGRGHWGAWHVC